MSIVNINYKGFVIKSNTHVNHVELLKKQPPQMLTYKAKSGETLLVFASGKCRIMGCKSHITSTNNMFPIPVCITHVQSVTACINLGYTINLYNLAMTIGIQDCMFEPEIFPALRITRRFNPLCVNVFASGKVVVLGLKTIHIGKTCRKIVSCINTYTSSSQV